MEELKSWFLENKRSFPWRENPTPYRVWVSEVMLQQTQAIVVVPYFQRWMETFPTIADLAEAPLSKVVKMWEGLGYYARAVRLHDGAKYIVSHHEGKIPSDIHLLEKIPGIGAYTKGAILSFGFQKREPAIDANVTRVITRLFKISGTSTSLKVQRRIRSEVEKLLPHEESWILSEALIELGAMVCKKKPLCSLCPLINSCLAFKEGVQELFPEAPLRIPTTDLFRIVGLIECEEDFLLRKGEKGKVMGELLEFFYVEVAKPPTSPHEALKSLEDQSGLKLQFLKEFPSEKHSFTRYRAHLFPYLCQAQEKKEGIWKSREELRNLSFSSGHKRLLNKYL